MINSDRPNESKEDLQKKIALDPKLIPTFEKLLDPFDKEGVLKFLIKHVGIPTPELRRQYWSKILECEEVKKEEGLYHKLLKREGDPNVMMTIEQDVNRTFPYYTYFLRGGKGQEVLYRILKAYSVYDRELGYTQGMAYIAAVVILHHNEEEEAFWTFTQMMKRPDLQFESVFSRNLIKLKISLCCIKRLLEIECPRLSRYFQSLELGPEIYCCSSFCTLYTMYFQFETTTYIWDLFFFLGWNFLMRLQLGILKRLETLLLQSGFIEVQAVINKNLEDMSPKEIWEISQGVIINEEQLKEWEQEEGQIVLEKELRKKNRRGLDKEDDGELGSIFDRLKSSFSYEEDVRTKMDGEDDDDVGVKGEDQAGSDTTKVGKIEDETNEDDIMDGLFGTLEEEAKQVESITVNVKKKKKKAEKKSLLDGLEDMDDVGVDYGDVNKIQEYLGKLEDGGKDDDSDDDDDDGMFSFDFDDKKKRGKEEKDEDSGDDEEGFSFEF